MPTPARRVRFAALCGLLLSLAALPAWAQQARAWLDRERIAAGESVALNIEYDSALAPTPDLAPLARDFELSGHSSRRSLERSGGRTVARTVYGVLLRPRRAGTLAVPSLAIGAARTAPLTLTVADMPAPAAARAGAEVFVESMPDDPDPYVQQSVGWTVRVYTTTPIQSGALDQPAVEGAAFQSVGQDARYVREVDGRRYFVYERRYLLVPERSGALAIPGATFEGRTEPNFLEDFFGRPGDSTRAVAPRRVLQVRAIPVGAPQPWLPLHDLRLRYRAVPQQLTAGAPATVTVEATADGAVAAQLPTLELPAAAGVQVFPEAPTFDERNVDGRPRVVVVRSFALVPAQAGPLRIDGLRIGWWDVRAGVARSATLPPLEWTVAPGAAPAPTSAGAPPTADRSAGDAPSVAAASPAGRGWVVATLAFAALWLATLLWALHRRAAPQATPAGAPPPIPRARDGAALARALADGTLADVDDALRAAAPHPASDLDAVAAQLDDPAQREAIEALRRARWAGGDGTAARAVLRDAFRGGPRWRMQAPPAPSPLPPLYPPR